MAYFFSLWGYKNAPDLKQWVLEPEKCALQCQSTFSRTVRGTIGSQRYQPNTKTNKRFHCSVARKNVMEGDSLYVWEE